MNLLLIRAGALISTILFFAAVYILIVVLRQKRDSIYIAFACITMIFTYLYAQALYVVLKQNNLEESSAANFKSLLLERYPYVTLIFDLILLIPYGLLFSNIRNWREKHITPMSIKAGLDTLPDGLLYYYENGSVKLVNHAMNEISIRIFGRPVTNGVDFADALAAGDEDLPCTVAYESDHRIVSFPNGDVYAFESSARELGGYPITEMICFNVTDEYHLIQELQSRNDDLKEQRRRLINLNDSVIEMTIDREILDTRIRIHDDLGKSLAATRYYITAGMGDRDTLLGLWRTNLRLLKHEETPVRRSGYSSVLKAASDVGVRVLISGELPTDPEYSKVIETALGECITNTFRHAGGDELNLAITDDGKDMMYTFSNNGEPPAEDVKETGGLKYLRRLTERVGGSMEVISRPKFELRIRLFKKSG